MSHALSTILNDIEREALLAAVSDHYFPNQHWNVMSAGQVKGSVGEEIYKHGYVNAIKNNIRYNATKINNIFVAEYRRRQMIL